MESSGVFWVFALVTQHTSSNLFSDRPISGTLVVTIMPLNVFLVRATNFMQISRAHARSDGPSFSRATASGRKRALAVCFSMRKREPFKCEKKSNKYKEGETRLPPRHSQTVPRASTLICTDRGYLRTYIRFSILLTRQLP